MQNKRKILEIGPGPNPMHHLREGKGVAPFELEENEDYTAIDLSRNALNAKVWDTLKEQYPNKVHIVIGDREDMPFKNEEFDEVVALGTISERIEEVDRIMKKGGILKIGTTKSRLKEKAEIKKLLNMDYEIIDEQDYVYEPNEKWPATDYVVVTFQKKK
jgi:ubiquinone/menaquinone biosynthesis C-methylase UbiE